MIKNIKIFKNKKITTLISCLLVINGLLFLFNNCQVNIQNENLVIEKSNFSSQADQTNSNPVAETMCEQEILNLYSRGWHNFLKTNCAICHSVGPGKGKFSNLDINTSYVDFQEIGYTKIANNAVNPSHNPPYSGIQHTQTINELKVEWQKGLADFEKCSGTKIDSSTDETQFDKITLKSVAKQIGLTKDGDKKTITWDLGKDISRVKGTDPIDDLGGAQFAITITRLRNSSGATYYTFSSPTIYGSTKDIRIQGVFINLNGFLLNYPTTFSYLDKNIRKGSKNDLSGLLSTGSLVAPKVVLETDTLSISYININAIELPAEAPPLAVSIGNNSPTLISSSTGYVDIAINLNGPAIEPIVVTLTENSDLCGVATTLDNSNTLFQTLSSTCLPDINTYLCPNNNCGVNDKKIGQARSVVGANWNRYDWDYKFPNKAVTFSLGETSKTVRIFFSKDIRNEYNRFLKVSIASVLGNTQIGSKSSVSFILNKMKNPKNSSDVLTFSELMDPKSGILGLNCVKCHNSQLMAGGYDMTDYELMITRKVLIPGNVDSKMYVRIHPTPEFLAKPMPQDGFLPQALIYEVERWLMNGAHNN